MAKKLGNLSVKTGEYTKDGETKGRYENIGSIMQGDNGQYLLIKRTFNPAGVTVKDGSDSILVSIFEDKEKSDAPKSKASSDSAFSPDDEIGF